MILVSHDGITAHVLRNLLSSVVLSLDFYFACGSRSSCILVGVSYAVLKLFYVCKQRQGRIHH